MKFNDLVDQTVRIEELIRTNLPGCYASYSTSNKPHRVFRPKAFDCSIPGRNNPTARPVCVHLFGSSNIAGQTVVTRKSNDRPALSFTSDFIAAATTALSSK